MTREELFEILGGIDDEYVAVKEPKRAKPWLKWGALAACLCVVIAGALRIAVAFIPNQATDTFREGIRYEMESVYNLPAEYDGKLLVQNLELSEAATVELYYNEGGMATDPNDWYSLIIADYQTDRELLIHCMFGDTTVDDWTVGMVFTEEATKTTTVNGAEVKIARNYISLEYEYWYYAIFEYDGAVYDVRVRSNRANDIYDLLNRLLQD